MTLQISRYQQPMASCLAQLFMLLLRCSIGDWYNARQSKLYMARTRFICARAHIKDAISPLV